jgi:ATP-dependent DNA helicase RecQ
VLFQKLRALRKEIADEQRVPPYVVFSDASLREMAQRQPVDDAAFRGIAGVGDQKVVRYGPPFMTAIRAHREALDPG